MTDYNHLFELNELAVKEARQYPKKRELYSHLVGDSGKHFIGVTGPRGVGKTVILEQLAANTQNSFYISLDTIEADDDLFEIAKTLSERYGFQKLLFDEIHYHKNYEKMLKKIYDFLEVRVIFSSSVSLSMLESAYDLSRRARLVHLYPFSFREYLFFKKDVLLPQLTLDNILKKEWKREHLRYEYLFEDYLKGGLYPFSLEEPRVLPLLENVIQKILQKDIPSVAKLSIDEISLLEKVIKFIGRSGVDGINYSSISSNLKITKYKAESYISLLKNAFVLHVLFPVGTNVLREPKVLMCLPFRLLYRDYDEAVGGLREDFTAEMLQMKGFDFYYLKTNRGAKTPDFLVKRDGDDIVIEVGGKSKGREQFKGVEVHKKIILSHSRQIEGIKRPLFLLGFV
ncbi:MAG: ATP-binding protein [Candidatus Aminicenantes bacterium]|nr:MAG: ATP-binding protein [Candidatus Aminicenantes bacterium]